MRALCVTVDLDRDVNISLGGAAAGSLDRGKGTAPRFTSSEKGLSLLSELFDEMSIKATFFAEASTLRKVNAGLLGGHCVGIHGVDHEDITSVRDVEEKRSILEKSAAAVRDAVGRAPECFRAPYMRIDDATLDILPEIGIKVDSSKYAAMTKRMIPEKLRSGVWEMAVPEGLDKNGKKIAAYLWPMHELKRVPDDYIRMASVMEEGAFVLATHTWHLVESRSKGMMTSEEIKKNVGSVRRVLEGIIDEGMRPMTLCGVRRIMEEDAR